MDLTEIKILLFYLPVHNSVIYLTDDQDDIEFLKLSIY